MTSIEPIAPGDHDEWLALWHGYLTFYESSLDDATTAATYARLVDPDSGIHGAVARNDDGRLVGLVHWLTHPATWTRADYCYLEDLFVSPDVRSGGVGRALIEHVVRWAEQNGSAKVYWLTAESNATARALYERVAAKTGMIQYQVTIR